MIILYYTPEDQMEEIIELAKPVGVKLKCVDDGKPPMLFISETNYKIVGYDAIKDYFERVHLIHAKMKEMPQSFFERHIGKFMYGLILFQLLAFTYMGDFMTGFLMACVALFIIHYRGR